MWKLDHDFKQTALAVWKDRKHISHGVGYLGERDTRQDTFCTALVTGWLTESNVQSFRSMGKDQLDGLNHEAMRLHRAQMTLRKAGREQGLPALLQERGLGENRSLEEAASPRPFGRKLADSITKLQATRVLIELQGSTGAHALGVRQKPLKAEFFDPNFGVYYGDLRTLGQFLNVYFKLHKIYREGDFFQSFTVTSLLLT